MSYEIPLPKISAETEAAQLAQIKSYLYQMAERLNWTLATIENGSGSAPESMTLGNASSPAAVKSNFGVLKDLIIKSADIVEAYSERISRKLAGAYVAKSDFGTYQEATAAELQATSTGISQLYTNTQRISDTVDRLYDAQIGVNAYVKTGQLYEDANGPVYGLEIGQTNDVEGQTVFSKFARFTSDRLSFYDRNDTEVAYISDYRLHITNAEITGSLILAGRFKIFYRNGLAFQWIGGGQ